MRMRGGIRVSSIRNEVKLSHLVCLTCSFSPMVGAESQWKSVIIDYKQGHRSNNQLEFLVSAFSVFLSQTIFTIKLHDSFNCQFYHRDIFKSAVTLTVCDISGKNILC